MYEIVYIEVLFVQTKGQCTRDWFYFQAVELEETQTQKDPSKLSEKLEVDQLSLSRLRNSEKSLQASREA